MKKFEFKNFSLKGIWNAFLMRTENCFNIKFFGKTFHHGYLGIIFLTIGIIYNYLLILSGILLITHDILAHVVRGRGNKNSILSKSS